MTQPPTEKRTRAPGAFDRPGDSPETAHTPSMAGDRLTRRGAGQPNASEDANSPLLREALAPADSYTSDGVYWADLPFGERWRWARAVDSAELRREWRLIWDMFRADPLAPISAYWSRYGLKGMGLFVEGFTLFSVGNLSSLFQATWPSCWKSYTACTAEWVYAVDYLEIVGIITGQFLVGIEADWIGRRFGMVQDALVMTLGTLMLIAAWGTSLNGWVICYAWSLFIYGIGVGGEYPMTSTSAMEGGGGPGSSTADKLHRGRNVQLAFLMQGWGQLFNQAVLIVLLLAFHSQGGPPYKEKSTQWTYRVSFAVILPFTLYLAYYRFYKVRYADDALRRAKRRSNTSGYDAASLKLVMHHYWPRLLATAGCWFCNDFFFYGSRLFQNQFLKIISPGGSVMTGWLLNLINLGVSLIGYYLAAFTIDNKFYGRRRMQSVGFIADFVFYLLPALLYPQLTKPGSGVTWFQTLYFLSNFFNQFGPNATTFLVAAECYPASVRGTAHGFSAAIGKVGALAPAILYNYTSSRTRFWVVCWLGLVGFLLTALFLPDTTGLDLREQERYWAFVREGRATEYCGPAVHPRHLSRFERWVQHRARFDGARDRAMRLEEIRAAWARVEGARTGEHEVDEDDSTLVDGDVGKYFEQEKAARSGTSLPAVAEKKASQ